MKRTPWMPLYCDDIISSTPDMTAEEFGAYVRLLCHIWTRGPVPIDEAVICRIAGCKRAVWKAIAPRFSACQRDDGKAGLSQTRLEAERLRSYLKCEERAASGRRGAASRWHNGSANGLANGKPIANRCQPQPQPQREKTNVTVTVADREASTAPCGAVLPRLASVDERDAVTDSNRAFVAQFRQRKAP